MLLIVFLGERIADLGRREDVFDGLGYFWPDTVPFDKRDCVFTLDITMSVLLLNLGKYSTPLTSKQPNVGSRLVLWFL